MYVFSDTYTNPWEIKNPYAEKGDKKMDQKEAMKVLCTGDYVTGYIDEIVVLVAPSDIKRNLECNDYEFEPDFIQDLTSVDASGNYEMCQGHSLSEVTLTKE
jgi:hypothetical protein